jgi:hypothetical protein
LEDAYARGADTVEVENGNAGADYGYSIFHVPSIIKSLWNGNDKRNSGERSHSIRVAPHAMELKYWWRAQAVAFLARFNDETTIALRKLRMNASAIILSSGSHGALMHSASSMVGPGWPPSRESDLVAQMAASFPFERGMTSIHVRHGDKGGEMTLVADDAYFAAAESLVLHHPMGLSRAAFISTEDPGTLESAVKEVRGWALMWYDVPRINSNGIDQLHKLSLLPAHRATATIA